MVKSLFRHFVALVIVTLVSTSWTTKSERIPYTSLWTNTPYQISDKNTKGFSLMTYAEVFTRSGDKFVQMEDDAERKSEYAPGGDWFQDSLWTFKLVVDYDSPSVTIHHVLYPHHLLALNADLESPCEGVPPDNYLILTSDSAYKDEGSNVGEKHLYAIWSIEQSTTGYVILLSNLATGKYAITRPRKGNESYRWGTVTDKNMFNFVIKTA